MHILVVNSGSSSVKYQLIRLPSQQILAKGNINIPSADSEKVNSYSKAIQQLLGDVSSEHIDVVGHRVVHGGHQFRHASIIDDTVIVAIRSWAAMAPLHNPNNLAGIEAAQALMPNIPHVAVFDTAFHATLPRRAYTYAIDQQLAQQYHLRRYGFHGSSHHYVSERASHFLSRPLNELRIVSLHLGNGASACAIEFGHSTETSMGMTPLEGLVMGSRSGDIDAGLILSLARDLNMSIDTIDELLNRQSGLKGLSGISNDLQEIETAAAEGNDNARLAIAVFAHRARKYIGAYAAVMGGVDAVILTGGIGENSAVMRQRILQRLDFLGVGIDEDKNIDINRATDEHYEKDVYDISRSNSRTKALIIKTNEELHIAKQSLAAVKQQYSNPTTIPIAVSARHIHLNDDTFKILFGEQSEPSHYKDLVQPGQYACKETVTLIGPRGKIENVRLLGPLRSKNQVEVSRTDEFTLGVDAPVRDSGRTKDSAPILIEGPNGTVKLKEGLICARRHIHMHPDDAKRLEVHDKDEVEVAITGGPRDLIFGDVLVRVSPGYKLEMHIDTDEANAAELNHNTDGNLVYTDINNASALIRLKKNN